jgi:adenylate kinase
MSRELIAPENTTDANFIPRAVILLGPPGCGKGTQSPKIVEKYNYVHLATGDMVRAAAMSGTEVGNRVKAMIACGALVSDEIMIELVRESIAENVAKGCKGIVFDGFPRTVQQARELDRMLHTQNMCINHVASFQIPDSVLVERVSGRRIHNGSGRSYHVKFNPPKVEGFDDITDEPLMQRQDDNEETLVARLSAFYAHTKPVIDHYETCVVNIDATCEMTAVWEAIDLALFGEFIRESIGESKGAEKVQDESIAEQAMERCHQEAVCDAQLQTTWEAAEGEALLVEREALLVETVHGTHATQVAAPCAFQMLVAAPRPRSRL